MQFLCLLFFLCASNFTFSAELSKRKMSPHFYEMMRYPADPETAIAFEHAKYKLKKNPQDENALGALQFLAHDERPYIPALLHLTQRAIEQKNLDEAFKLSYKGVQLLDPESMYVHATLLLNSPQVPLLAHDDPRKLELIARNLLFSTSMPFYLAGKRMHFPQAGQLLEKLDGNEIYRGMQSAITNSFLVEKTLNSCSKEERVIVEKEAYADGNGMLGCYFIKRSLKPFGPGDDSTQKALDWAEHLAHAPFFNYDSFWLFGGYAAIERIAYDLTHPEHARASFLLGQMDYTQLSLGQQVDLEALERNLKVGAAHDVRAFLMLASYMPEQTALRDYADQIIKRLDEIDPSLYATITHDLIQIYYALMQKSDSKFCNGLVKLLKNTVFKDVRDALAKDSELAGKLGPQLLQITDALVEQAKSKGRPDHRKIHDAGLALTKAAASSLNDQAAWALVAHSLHGAAPEAQRNALDEYVAQAVITTQTRIETHKPFLVDRSDLQKTLKKLEDATISSDSCHALAQWYLKGVPGLIEPNEVKAVEYLAKTSDAVPALQKVFDESRINDPAACLKAAIVLHKNSSLTVTRNLFFAKAVIFGSIQVKKEMAEYCVQHRDLVPLACNAVDALHQELTRADSVEQAEKLCDEYVQLATNELMKWALGTHSSKQGKIEDRHPAAIMFLNEPAMLNLFDENKKKLLEGLAEWAAINGHPEALNAVEHKFKTLKKEPYFIERAVDYWHAWLKLYGNIPEKENQKKEAYELIKTLSDWSLEPDKKNQLVVPISFTHYRLANMCMNTDPVMAVNHILVIESLLADSMQKMPQIAQHIASTGTYDLLYANADAGVDWACYALACVELNRLNLFVENHHQDHEACFAQIDKIKSLLEKAKTFDTTQLDARLRKQKSSEEGRTVLTLGEIEYRAFDMAKLLNRISGKFNEAVTLRGSKELLAAVKSNYPLAHYHLGKGSLTGQLSLGQETLEGAITSLCKAAELGVDAAKQLLANIYEQGFAYCASGGGNITAALRAQMAQSLQVRENAISKTENQDAKVNALGEFEQAVADLDDKEKVAHALTVFQRLSGEGDVRAHAYLGLMYRDGLGVERSDQKAQEYSIRALKDCVNVKIDNSPTHLKALSIAYEATRSLATKDVEVALMRCRYLLRGMAAHQIVSQFPVCMHDIEIIEQQLAKSSDPAITNLIFTSGLMKELVNTCANTSSIKICLSIVKLCAKRCLKVHPSQLSVNKELTLLTLPFAYLRDLLDESIIGLTHVKAAFEQISRQEAQEIIDLLRQMVSLGYLEPFAQVLGSLKVCLGIANQDKRIALDGINNWEQAEKQGDLRAGFLWALIKLRGENMISRMVTKKVIKDGYMQNITTRDGLINAPKVGLAKLKEIAARGHAQAYALMGQWYLETNDALSAMECYKQMMTRTPDTGTGAVGFLESIAREYAKSSEEDRRLIAQAIGVSQKNKIYAIPGAIYASYLRIVKNYEGISDEQALNYITQTALSGKSSDKHIFEFLKESQFAKKFQTWLASFENKRNTVSDDFMAKAYFAYAILLYSNMVNSTNDVGPQIFAACDKALQIKPNYIDVETLKAKMHYLAGIKGDSKSTAAMKLSVMKCCQMLQKQNLKLDAVPILNNLLANIATQGAVCGSLQKNGNIVNTGNTLVTMINDVQWAEAIIKKFTPEPVQS